MNNQILLKKAHLYGLFQRFRKPINIKQMDQQTLLQANILAHSILKNAQQLNLNNLLMPNSSELLLSKLIRENKSVQRMIRRPSELDLKTPFKLIQSQISSLKKLIRSNQTLLKSLQSGKFEAALQIELSHLNSALQFQNQKNKRLTEQLNKNINPDSNKLEKQIALLRSDIDRIDAQIQRTRRLVQRQKFSLKRMDAKIHVERRRGNSLKNKYTFIKSQFLDIQ